MELILNNIFLLYNHMELILNNIVLLYNHKELMLRTRVIFSKIFICRFRRLRPTFDPLFDNQMVRDSKWTPMTEFDTPKRLIDDHMKVWSIVHF